MAATVQGGSRRTDDVVGGTPFDLGSAQANKGRSRVPEILLGTLLVALFALGGAWFFSTSTSSTGFVALLNDVQRGDVIERTDLVTVQVRTDTPIQAIRAENFQTIVGQVALVDLAAGTLVAPQQFAEQADIPTGQGIVGLSLSVGEYPTAGLRTGDLVRVVAVPAGNAPSNAPAEVLVAQAVVTEVQSSGGDARFISLTMDTSMADQVAAVAADGRVRLIQVPASSAGTAVADPVPTEPAEEVVDE